MDTARQVLRFSIPGSITLMIGLGLLVLSRVLQGDDWGGIESAVRGNVSAVAVIFSTIPLGFFIYQMYYAAYRAFVWPWPWKWSEEKLWVRSDRGANVLEGLPVKQLAEIENLFGVELNLDAPTLEKVNTWLGRTAHAHVLAPAFVKAALEAKEHPYERYRKRWSEHWNIVRALIEISDDSTNSGSALRSEYTTLSDLYHALGACRIGVLLAEFTSIFAGIGYGMSGGSWWGALANFGVVVVIGTAFFFIFHRARGNTWLSAQHSLTLGLTGLFRRQPGLLGK
jgi:hypothetical protein